MCIRDSPRTAEVHSTCTHIRDEVECVGHAFEILAFQTKWRHRSESDAEKQRFMSCKQFVDRNVAPDSCLPTLNAETFQKGDLTQRRRLVHLVVGYAVRDETARLIVRVLDDDAVADLCELCSTGQSRGTCPYNPDAASSRFAGCEQADVSEHDIVSGVCLEAPDVDRTFVEIVENTGACAQHLGWTHPGA